MNKKHQCRTTSSDPKSLPSARLVYDERVAFVESVCAALNDSRFGHGRTLVLIKKRRELDDIVRLDLGLMETENVSYDLTPLGRIGGVGRHRQTGRSHSRFRWSLFTIHCSLFTVLGRILAMLRSLPSTGPPALARGSPTTDLWDA